MARELTEEDGKRALAEHAADIGRLIHARHGPVTAPGALEKVLTDEECVRFPVQVVFAPDIEDGMFGRTERRGENPSDGFVVVLHEHFKDQASAIPPLVLYLLVTVNYGEFATATDAEAFGAAAMGMEVDPFYDLICMLADSIPSAD